MDDLSGKPSKGFVRSMLELLGVAESEQTSRRAARANRIYLVVVLILVASTGGMSFGKRMLLVGIAAVVIYPLVAWLSRFLPEPRRRSDIPPGSH